MLYAFCFRSGEVYFESCVPEGAIEIAKGRSIKWMNSVKIKCRLAYDGVTWLVPGIPEAKTDEEALVALTKFRGWINGTN